MAEPDIVEQLSEEVSRHESADHQGDQRTIFFTSKRGDVTGEACALWKNGKQILKSEAPDNSFDRSSEIDLEFVKMTTSVFANRDSNVPSDPQISISGIQQTTEDELMPMEDPDEKLDRESENIVQRLSKMYAYESGLKTLNLTDLPRSSSIRLKRYLQGFNMDMASAIYSEDAIIREDMVSYRGYNIRAQGGDVCISSVSFNRDSQNLSILVKIAEYDQFYRGVVTRIRSQPRVVVDDDRWTMLYGALDDDNLGVVEIEVPPGIATGDIRYEGPCQGFITIDVPRTSNYSKNEPKKQVDGATDPL